MNNRGRHNQAAIAVGFAVLAWLIGLSALVGLMWIGSLAPAYLSGAFATVLPAAWVQVAGTVPSKLLGAAAACGWLLWTMRESAVREHNQRWLQAFGVDACAAAMRVAKKKRCGVKPGTSD